MNNLINIKILSEDALSFLKINLELITEKIMQNEDNKWIYNTFPQPMFVEKKIYIDDFSLKENLNCNDKDIDFENSIIIYNTLKSLPRYLLCDERFWLWLHFEMFYKEVKMMMKVNGVSTIKDHRMHGQGKRRGLMFGVLSRCYFRVALTIDNDNPNDKYFLTRRVIDNPERFRNLTWRSFSSQEHLVRGALKGEKRAPEDTKCKENNDWYPEIAKYISVVGSVRLLDKISEQDMEGFVYKKMLSLIE